jgi:hypothetical protein
MAPHVQPPASTSRDERLAYVFFHRPRRTVGRKEYERALAEFHIRLARSPTRGFRENAALRLPQAPWAETVRRPLYLDWYTLDGFGALDPIRDVAYRPPWDRFHRAIARRAADGWGALYASGGSARPPDLGEQLVWFSSEALPVIPWGKPLRAGPSQGTLWRRQLALGPSPEFCWVTTGAVPPKLRRRASVAAPEFVVRRDRTG